MIYAGMELGTFFEIPWNSPCYQVLRGINPILQMIFTFSQMYFVFMNARVSNSNDPCIVFMYRNQTMLTNFFSCSFSQLNIHKFKCISRFGLAHIIATNISIWVRTLVKECNKEIAVNRARLNRGVTEDFMILGK